MKTDEIPELSESDLDRFNDYCTPSDGCITWTGPVNNYGYGRFGFKGKRYLAHRVAFEISGQVAEQGMVVDHTCFNRRCVNPDHLRLATVKQNLENRSGADRDSITGVRGVYPTKGGRFAADVRHNGKLAWRGHFASIEEASAAVAEARSRIFEFSQECA